MFRQGSLDTLCGIYAIINSTHEVCATWESRLKPDHHRALFRALCEELATEGDLAGALAGEGMGVRTLRKLLRRAHMYVEDETGLPFTHKRAFNSEPVSLDRYWDVVRDHVHENGPGSVLISLTGRHCHWSCIRTISEEGMVLRDSDGLIRLSRARCTTGAGDNRRHHVLWPTETLLIT